MLRVLLEASALSDEERAAYLRREGLHEAQLEEWRAAVTGALQSTTEAPDELTEEARRIRELEQEIDRKDRALAEATALLALREKIRGIWGDEDDDTPKGKRSGT